MQEVRTVDDVANEIRRLLVERFGTDRIPESIPADEPLFAVGVGLSSIEGVEFLVLIEQHFGIKIKHLDRWLDDEPTLENVAQYVLQQLTDPPHGDIA